MNDPNYYLRQDGGWRKPHSRRSRPSPARHGRSEDGFQCIHCHAFVSSAAILSGVGNRNHCPYCLWSRHLDLYTAGDRLSACKAPMEPVGLVLKNSPKKYGSALGELMLVHFCLDCGAISINRIAADDVPANILDVFECSHPENEPLVYRLEEQAISCLGASEKEIVYRQLFGISAVDQFVPVMA